MGHRSSPGNEEYEATLVYLTVEIGDLLPEFIEEGKLEETCRSGNLARYDILDEINIIVEREAVAICPYVEGLDGLEPLYLEFPFTSTTFYETIDEAEDLSQQAYDMYDAEEDSIECWGY
jgi:hypothetical protein